MWLRENCGTSPNDSLGEDSAASSHNYSDGNGFESYISAFPKSVVDVYAVGEDVYSSLTVIVSFRGLPDTVSVAVL